MWWSMSASKIYMLGNRFTLQRISYEQLFVELGFCKPWCTAIRIFFCLVAFI